MLRRGCPFVLVVFVVLVGGCASAKTVRFATFNSALSKPAAGELLATMRTTGDPQARAVAEIIQRVRPDVLLLQEFDHGGDYDPDGQALRLFQTNYLGVGQNGGRAIHYEHVYLAPSNTGAATGVDLNGDGLVAPCPGAEVNTDAYAADCHGWGRFPGQYAFVVLSKYPIDRRNIRKFGNLLWKDLPGNHLPPDYYPDAAKDVLRLSSKNHVDVPILINKKEIHVLAAHPTPPTFDGPEDRNGRRNYDEIGLLLRVVKGAITAEEWEDPPYDYAPDDNGNRGSFPHTYRRNPWITNKVPWALSASAGSTDFDPFVVMGDLNADPADGESFEPPDAVPRPKDARSAMWQLLLYGSGSFDDPQPHSAGGKQAAKRDAGANVGHRTDPAADTADWDDSTGGPGNLRVDYVLPSVDLNVVAGGVFWPTPDAPLMGTTLGTVERASDHRLVWIDVKLP